LIVVHGFGIAKQGMPLALELWIVGPLATAGKLGPGRPSSVSRGVPVVAYEEMSYSLDTGDVVDLDTISRLAKQYWEIGDWEIGARASLVGLGV
jgi:hypothetical protein